MFYIVLSDLVVAVYINYKVFTSKTGVRGSSRNQRQIQVPVPQKTGYTVTDMAGAEGEFVVSQTLSSLGSEYVVLNDILLDTRGGYTQVDHVVVSVYGIFIIETKNYSGKVVGSENAVQWKHYRNDGSGHDFYNPIKQNRAHCIAICNVLGLKLPDVVPIVVFTDKCTLDVSCNSYVVNLSNLHSVFMRYRNQRLTPQQVKTVVNRIVGMNIVDSTARAAHLNQVSVKQAIGTHGREFVLNTGICPKCGGQMQLKDGKYGQFLGCANYPRCRYTARIS